ncbi:MAG: hypothetical protein KDH88_10160 [Chromatiales bacterium]|nr:hypothetical protein [Gammaproteobacteria bacterium]MCB1876327.1 hypothetical protein [Chromatiales bacterium]
MSKFIAAQILLLSATLFPAAGVFASEAEDQCRQYAKEDGVPAEEMADYLRDCIANIQGDSGPEQKSEPND